MTRQKKTYYIPLGTGVAYKFSARGDIYDSLKSTLGVLDSAPANSRILQGAATTYGLPRISVKYIKSGTDDTAVFQTGTLLCAFNKLEESLQTLPAGQYRGKDIVEAYIRRRRIFI